MKYPFRFIGLLFIILIVYILKLSSFIWHGGSHVWKAKHKDDGTTFWDNFKYFMVFGYEKW